MTWAGVLDSDDWYGLDLMVSWPVLDDTATVWELEREARSDWSGHVADAGRWGTTDPVFAVTDADDGEGLLLVGRAQVLHGPMELRSGRYA